MAKARHSKKTANSVPVTTVLKELRERADLSMSDMAKMLGYKGASSYQRYEDPTIYKSDFLPPRLISKLVKTLPGKGTPPIKAAEILSLLGSGFDPLARPKLPNIGPKFQYLRLLGDVQAGVWLETSETQVDEASRPMLPILPLYGVEPDLQFAVTVRGESMNRVAKDGDIAICASTQNMTGMKPRTGDIVLVQRLRDDGSIHELTIKRYMSEFDGTTILVPESTDSRYQEAINLDEPESVDVTVAVTAVVLAIVRLPNDANHLLTPTPPY